jgi:hypothetical protein
MSDLSPLSAPMQTLKSVARSMLLSFILTPISVPAPLWIVFGTPSEGARSRNINNELLESFGIALPRSLIQCHHCV